jgi:hypothetical protein
MVDFRNLPLSPAGRRYGYHRDPPDARDYGLARFGMLASPEVPIPPVMDLEEWTGPVKDQGALGACTAFAGCGMREYLFRKYHDYEARKVDVGAAQAVFSPLYLYYRELRKLGVGRRHLSGGFRGEHADHLPSPAALWHAARDRRPVQPARLQPNAYARPDRASLEV